MVFVEKTKDKKILSKYYLYNETQLPVHNAKYSSFKHRLKKLNIIKKMTCIQNNLYLELWHFTIQLSLLGYIVKQIKNYLLF